MIFKTTLATPKKISKQTSSSSFFTPETIVELKRTTQIHCQTNFTTTVANSAKIANQKCLKTFKR
jgi:hypothetical protein